MIRRILIILIAIAVLVPAGFRGAALLREVQTVEQALPDAGRLVATAMGQVYVEEAGPDDGIPVLLVHGSVGWARLWAETSAALAGAGYRAIAFDLAPMGFSDRDPNADYSRENQADRINALIAALEIRPIIAAHSFGAGPGLEAVMKTPDAYAGLIIIDGAVGVGSHELDKSMPLPLRPLWLRRVALSMTVTNPLATKWLLSLFLHRKDRANDHYADILRRPAVLQGSTEELAKWLPSLLVPPKDALSTRPEALRALAKPTAIIWGREDTATPLAQGEELASLIPDSRLIVLDDVGHIPQIEDPEAFNAALIDAVQKLVDPGQ